MGTGELLLERASCFVSHLLLQPSWPSKTKPPHTLSLAQKLTCPSAFAESFSKSNARWLNRSFYNINGYPHSWNQPLKSSQERGATVKQQCYHIDKYLSFRHWVMKTKDIYANLMQIIIKLENLFKMFQSGSWQRATRQNADLLPIKCKRKPERLFDKWVVPQDTEQN